jgi:hypothetical protein
MPTRIIVHYNKAHNQDINIPAWVFKAKGETYYVNHIVVEPGLGFSTKETPDNDTTKASLKFKGNFEINEANEARIFP